LPLGHWAWAGRLICRRFCLTLRRSRQPPPFLFAMALGDSQLLGFVNPPSPAAAAQLPVGPERFS
jgi:hypothetical protein